MALPIQSSCFMKKPSSLFHQSLHSPAKIRLIVRAESSSQPESIDERTEEVSVLAPPEKSTKTGLGFGSSSSSGKLKEKERANDNVVSSKKKKSKKGRERASTIIRRSPVEKPAFPSQQGESQSEQQSKNESAFLLTWLGLGSLILVEGIALAASGPFTDTGIQNSLMIGWSNSKFFTGFYIFLVLGFLPEEWDKFFVKYLYPSFTPTVFLFVAGTVTYGVLKYLQNEKRES